MAKNQIQEECSCDTNQFPVTTLHIEEVTGSNLKGEKLDSRGAFVGYNTDFDGHHLTHLGSNLKGDKSVKWNFFVSCDSIA